MKPILTILILMALMDPCCSQSVIASGGQSASSNTLNASATIGEAIIGSSANSSTNANQGFQQPLQSDLSTSIYSPKGVKIDVTLSPHPVVDNFRISLSENISAIQLIIYSSTGEKVKMYRYESTTSHVEESLVDLHSGNYYLQILDLSGRQLGSLPLVKI